MGKKIYAFYTINQLGDWKQVMSSQVTKIIKSGLFDEITRVFVGSYGNEMSIALPQKFSVIHRSNDSSSIALEMLDIISNFAKNNDCIILNMSNLHSEYYGRANYSNVQSWRDYMEHFNIISWRECVQRLEKYDTVGVDWLANDDGTGRFDGDFWWATSSYLSKLPTLDQLKSTNITVEPLKDKWIGMCKPKVGVLFNSGIADHIRVAIPKNVYLDGIAAQSNPEIVPPVPRAKREPALEPHRAVMTPPLISPPPVQKSPPPLIPVNHAKSAPSLNVKRKVAAKVDPSMKLLVDCRNGDGFLKSYVDVLMNSEVYNKFVVRVALFGNNDYEPIKNFICYGPSLTKDVIASIPMGIKSYILYIDASVSPSAEDLNWIAQWPDHISKLNSASIVTMTSDGKARTAWMWNYDTEKNLL